MYNHNFGEEKGEVSIAYSSPFKIIEEICCKGSISYDDIINHLKLKYPERKEDVLNKYLLQLITESYLVSDLTIPICNTDELTELIKKIQDYQELDALGIELNNIQKKISKYESTEIGDGCMELESIYESMRKLHNHEKSSFLQIDCEIKNLPPIISKNNLNVFCDFITYFNDLQAMENKKILSDYELKFIEKYGSYVEVPIFELLDESIGIGAPEEYKNPENRFTKPLLKENDNFWQVWIFFRCI